jgi:hypothetical protein
LFRNVVEEIAELFAFAEAVPAIWPPIPWSGRGDEAVARDEGRGSEADRRSSDAPPGNGAASRWKGWIRVRK